MSSTPLGSVEQLRAQLTVAHAERFGSRADEWLSAAIETTAHAIALLSSTTLSAYDPEPDFITGSSDKEPSA
jgi:hypothetical protein